MAVREDATCAFGRRIRSEAVGVMDFWSIYSKKTVGYTKKEENVMSANNKAVAQIVVSWRDMLIIRKK